MTRNQLDGADKELRVKVRQTSGKQHRPKGEKIDKSSGIRGMTTSHQKLRCFQKKRRSGAPSVTRQGKREAKTETNDKKKNSAGSKLKRR